MIIEWNKVSKLKLGSNDLIFYCYYEVAAIWAAKRHCYVLADWSLKLKLRLKLDGDDNIDEVIADKHVTEEDVIDKNDKKRLTSRLVFGYEGFY